MNKYVEHLKAKNPMINRVLCEQEKCKWEITQGVRYKTVSDTSAYEMSCPLVRILTWADLSSLLILAAALVPAATPPMTTTFMNLASIYQSSTTSHKAERLQQHICRQQKRDAQMAGWRNYRRNILQIRIYSSRLKLDTQERGIQQSGISSAYVLVSCYKSIFLNAHPADAATELADAKETAPRRRKAA